MADMREDCDYIIKKAIEGVLPEKAVAKALEGFEAPAGRLILVAIGKAAYRMAASAYELLGDRIDSGIVITKYGHLGEDIPGITLREAGHPIPDENGYRATEEALLVTDNLTEDDMVLFLVSGGGSALFEKPLISPKEVEEITGSLLKCAASIGEINCIRKRLSAVKGGKFALHCSPARVFSIVLSDVLGDHLDVIASGPAYPDKSTAKDALDIAQKYGLKLSKEAMALMEADGPNSLPNVETIISGSVKELCRYAAEAAKERGYDPLIITDSLDCEAKEAGREAAGIGAEATGKGEKKAYIMGGETVVKVKGQGLGGRNQEIALTAAKYIDGMDGVAVFSFGSDGTDGPTDAAGGYVDASTVKTLRDKGLDIDEFLADNDSYHALEKSGGLIITGPTGTNVNDATLVLVSG